jgi:hypothetical protein
MVMVEEFRRHAGECRQMARGTRDLESKASWNGLAERWDRCAAFENGRVAPDRHVDRYRRAGKPMYDQAS